MQASRIYHYVKKCMLAPCKYAIAWFSYWFIACFSYWFAEFLMTMNTLNLLTLQETTEWYFFYARDVLQTPFPEGEAVIAISAKYSYFYASDVLHTPFRLGEKAIATSAEWSYNYAIDVLKEPFPLGEVAIAKSVYYSYHYAENVLKGRLAKNSKWKPEQGYNYKFFKY
jgi:hypothetical protein